MGFQENPKAQKPNVAKTKHYSNKGFKRQTLNKKLNVLQKTLAK